MQQSNINGDDFEIESGSLRTKLQKLREKNTSLVSQNHKLMSELENMRYEMQQERSKVRLLLIQFYLIIAFYFHRTLVLSSFENDKLL